MRLDTAMHLKENEFITTTNKQLKGQQEMFEIKKEIKCNILGPYGLIRRSFTIGNGN